MSASFESMYASTMDKVLNGTGRETFDAVKLMQSIQKQPYTPANGAKYPGGAFGNSLQQIARLIKANVLPAMQSCRGAPYVIRREDLENPAVRRAIENGRAVSQDPRQKVMLYQ